MRAGQKLALALFVAVFCASGLFAYLYSFDAAGREKLIPYLGSSFIGFANFGQSFFVGLHFYCWMLLGMAANYLWDMINHDQRLGSIDQLRLMAPSLISPIVFYPIYSTLTGDVVKFAAFLLAFQNGFFWQTVFKRAGETFSTNDTNK